MQALHLHLYGILLLLTGGAAAIAQPPTAANPRLMLMGEWEIQSAAKIQEDGSVLSRPHPATTTGWYRAKLPATVLDALVQNQVYPDPYFGMNLRSIPGTSYPIGENFSNLPMPNDSPFRDQWWYRREFALPASYAGRKVWLHFDGINYRANIWLNGVQIADRTQVVGPFRFFEFDITVTARPGEINTLAVEVFPPQANDLGITWVDVNPCPPDKNMGLYRPVYITTSGPVTVSNTQVLSKLMLPSLAEASLSVFADLKNATPRTVKGRLTGKIEDRVFSQEVELEANSVKTVEFAAGQFAQLKLTRPRVWWPAGLGAQEMYRLTLEFEADGRVSDGQEVRFGIRETDSELTAQGYRVFKVNGHRLLARGAGWWSDMLLRISPERQEWGLRYFRDMNLNVLRMDGKFEDEHFLNLCDEYGILIMPGWCCCDHWEKWDNWKEEDHLVSAESLRDQLRRFRNHPSALTWLYADDKPPPPIVEQRYVGILREMRWPNPFQSSATGKPSTRESTGLKMTGPYDYVPPSYWLANKDRGGAFGFNTETAPCPTIPSLESLRKFIPPEHLWPIDEFWYFHAGGNVFKDIKHFTKGIADRYGEPRDLEDFWWKAQLVAYEGERAMFEGFGRNKYEATGVLHEMLNSAWPSLIWNLYDHYLTPVGAYFGAKKGCEPLHIQYAYDDRSIQVVNSNLREFKGLKASARILDLNLKERFATEAGLEVAPDGRVKAFELPEIADLTTTYFLRLRLADSEDRTISTNFYCLSTRPDVFDWTRRQAHWHYSPTTVHADFTGLQTLPKVALHVAGSTARKGAEYATRVTVSNPTGDLALFVRLRVTKPTGEEVLPVLWEDNYFELLPGEERVIAATYPAQSLDAAGLTVAVDGWNITAMAVPVGASSVR